MSTTGICSNRGNCRRAGARLVSSEKEKAGAVFIYEIPAEFDDNAILKQRLDSPEGEIWWLQRSNIEKCRSGRCKTHKLEKRKSWSSLIYEIPPGDEDAILKQRLVSPGPETNAEYGYSVALRDGGLIVGEPNPDGVGGVYRDQMKIVGSSLMKSFHELLEIINMAQQLQLPRMF